MIEFGLPGARVAFSTRKGGVSEGPFASLNLGHLTDDDPAAVAENRRRLAAAAGTVPEEIAMSRQVHGADLAEWEEPPSGGELRRVDGHLSAERGLPLLVLVADCLPVALAGGGRVAMLHCGWRGLAAGILERALDRFDEPPAAAFGPAIGPCCYEVGPEVLAAFEPLAGVAEGRMLDLKAVARRTLDANGVALVEDAAHCTSCRPDLFFSHRRDGGVTGRQGGLVWRT
ncbi:MAG: polyphenol oxidase family protein [Thermoleophilaceae bacterium]